MMRRRKVLVIDDEVDFVDMLKMRLEANNYTVVTAFDGPSGLKKSESEAPDVILLDVMMPGMDGFKVLSRLKVQDQTRLIPVIMLTAKGESRSILNAQALGVSDYLVKPVDTKEMFAVLDRYA
jgi:DNA-binding response OmpR family regulator